MDKITLKAEKRQEVGRKVNVLRRQGLVPAVVYGKGITSENVWFKELDLKRIMKKSGGSVILNLEVDGEKSRNVLIQEIQKHPVRGYFLHVDFYQVNMAEKIETSVELSFIGEAPAVREMGGVLVKSLDELEIKCLPADLPSHIDVSIEGLKTFDDVIAVKDLVIPKGVEVKVDSETVVALVEAPRTEEELKELESKVEADVTQVEGVVKPEASESTSTEAENKENK